MRIWRLWSVRCLCLTLLCLLFVIYPLLAGQGPVHTRGGGDSPFLFVRLEQLVAGLRAGAFPVRWMPDAAYGLGYPFFDFYAALPYYVAALFRFLGWGPILSLQATQVLGVLLAAGSMFLLARDLFRHPAAAALAAVAYTCAPFHLVNVYVRGDSLSEFYAFVFYPLVFWALRRLRADPSPSRTAWLALSYGGLLLSHNLSALILSPFVAAYALYLLWPAPQPAPGTPSPPHPALWQRVDWRALWRIACGGALGLALSASLYQAVLFDLDHVWMGVKDIQTSGFFHYSSQFRGRDLIQPALLFDYEISGPTPFAMGAVQAAVISTGLIALLVDLLRHRRKRTTGARSSAAFWVAGFALSTVMITPLSRFLWDRFPLLPIIQFPWRFLSVQAFFGALIVGELAERLPRPWWVATIGSALLTIAAVGNLRPEYLPIDELDVTPERLALFESFTTNIGTTIRGEYLPASVEPRPWASAASLDRGRSPPPAALEGQVTEVTLLGRSARSERWRVNVASDQAHLVFYTLYFPGWRADRVTGERSERLAIEPLPNSGLVSLRLSQGQHTISLRFVRTPERWIADLISLAAGLTIGASFVLERGPLRGTRWKRVVAAAGGFGVLLGVLFLLGGMLSARGSTSTADPLSMDFDRMPFLHHNPDGIDFDGRARLLAYQYEETVSGGSALTVTLRWMDGADLIADLRLVSPADPHPDLAPAPAPLSEARTPIEGTTTRHVLPIPPDAASGMYYLALRVFDGPEAVHAVNERGDTLGTTYLRPVWVANPRPAQEADPILARFGDRILLRDDVQVREKGGHWEVKLTWQAAAPIPANYTCSLNMLDAGGHLLAQRDLEGGPGHGFWPTSAWPTGEWLTDRLRLPVPPDVEAKSAAALHIVLYDRSLPGLPAAGSVVVPLTERAHINQVPEAAHQVGADFGSQVRLLGYDLAQDASALRLTLHWQSLRPMPDDYTVFVHLFDPESEAIAVQFDARPLQGTYPTNWWRTGEVVSDEVALPLTEVTAGRYMLAVGLYDRRGDRLPAVDAHQMAIPDGRLILEDWISIPVR